MKPPLWSPSPEQVAQANLTEFRNTVNKNYKLALATYLELYQWSIDDRASFWEAMWDYGQVVHSQTYQAIGQDLDKMPGSKWFPGARLNFAQNLLRFRDDQPALVFWGEDGSRQELSYKELFFQVSQAARGLKESGVETGDRVVGFMPNLPQTIVAMLAAVSLGAVWSSCSPDFGIQGVLDRFGQIKPKVLFTANGYFYNCKAHDSLARTAGILDQIPSLEKVVVVPYTEAQPDISALPRAVSWPDFLEGPAPEPEFAQLPFDHPVYIMYSSGTTGLPKCMVHGAGGTLLQHLKEHLLHCDLKRQDKIFYFTTCGWMMWNWLVSALATGATLLLFDGSPFHPGPEILWKMAEKEKMTIFGTSARYLAALENTGLKPGREFDL
ncbi:MAG: AMP-binding protein, partial [Deltaproteobacteria bacterium]|nr:AMP-binding protein [Deltaproteobacteria bacterium]